MRHLYPLELTCDKVPERAAALPHQSSSQGKMLLWLLPWVFIMLLQMGNLITLERDKTLMLHIGIA